MAEQLNPEVGHRLVKDVLWTATAIVALSAIVIRQKTNGDRENQRRLVTTFTAYEHTNASLGEDPNL